MNTTELLAGGACPVALFAGASASKVEEAGPNTFLAGHWDMAMTLQAVQPYLRGIGDGSLYYDGNPGHTSFTFTVPLSGTHPVAWTAEAGDRVVLVVANYTQGDFYNLAGTPNTLPIGWRVVGGPTSAAGNVDEKTLLVRDKRVTPAEVLAGSLSITFQNNTFHALAPLPIVFVGDATLDAYASGYDAAAPITTAPYALALGPVTSTVPWTLAFVVVSAADHSSFPSQTAPFDNLPSGITEVLNDSANFGWWVGVKILPTAGASWSGKTVTAHGTDYEGTGVIAFTMKR